jgi:hypothetical protein
MTTDYRALCAELAQVLAEEYGVEREFSSGGPLLGNGAIELLARARIALAQPEPVEPMMINCRWDGPSPEPHASVGDWFEQEGSKGLLCGLRISALPFRGGARTSPEPEGATDEELMAVFWQGAGLAGAGTGDHILRGIRSVLTRYSRPTTTDTP